MYDSDANRFQRVCADATVTARNLANTRGSVGTPEYMENEFIKIAKGHPKVKEVRALDADQLQELGMNLFYNVGKGAIS